MYERQSHSGRPGFFTYEYLNPKTSFKCMNASALKAFTLAFLLTSSCSLANCRNSTVAITDVFYLHSLKKRPLTVVFVTSSTFFLSHSSSSALHVCFLIALTVCNTLGCIGVKYYLVLIYTKELKVTPCVYVSLLKKASVMPL